MSMEGVQANGQTGDFKVFITNNGGHGPEMLAKITMAQTVHPESNGERVELLRSILELYYGVVQSTVRSFYRLTNANGVATQHINNVLMRDLATLLTEEQKSFGKK